MSGILDAHIKSGKFHHGYLLVGDMESSGGLAFKAASNILKPNNTGNRLEIHPDYFYKTYEFFSIDDSHEIRKRASMRPLVGENKVFILEILSIGIESSNSLLKLLEEPYDGTYFFIITSSLDEIISTLRSRLIVISNPRQKSKLEKEREDFCTKFLLSLPNKRIEIVKKLSDDKQKAIEFLNELEIAFTRQPLSSCSTTVVEFLEEMQKCKDFLYQKGGSTRMILEHIALILPRVI